MLEESSWKLLKIAFLKDVKDRQKLLSAHHMHLFSNKVI